MMIPMPSPQQCPGRSFFVSENTFEAASRPKFGGVSTLVDTSFLIPWSSNGVSSEETPMCDLPIRDLMSGGLADFRPRMDDCSYEDLSRRWPFSASITRNWSSSRSTSCSLLRGGAPLRFDQPFCEVGCLLLEEETHDLLPPDVGI